MTITAKVIADSVGPKARRLTTLELKYPRFIHAEFMTHRHFSRNASSSRAIPVERQIEMIQEDTAMPIHWGMNQRGMQAEQESNAPVMVPQIMCTTEGREVVPMSGTAEQAWLTARDRAIEIAKAFVKADYHKQVVNRILEPFSHISVVCTSSQYDNFFALRRHADAQPEIKALADAMYDAMQASEPKMLGADEWHLPYILESEKDYVESHENIEHDDVPLTSDDLIKASVARCARVSYLTHDGKQPSLDADLKLYDRLVGSAPLHASPAEHQAKLDDVIFNSAELPAYKNRHLAGNLQGGWIQYRKLLPGECADNWDDPLNVFP